MRVLGLDIGATSIGWAIVEFDQDAKNEIDKKSNNKIIDLGIRLFDGVAEDRSGKLLAQNWRNSKSSRQRYKRKKERLKAIENEFKSIGFLDNSYNKEQFFAKFHFENKDIFILRAKALEEKLSPKQIFACIYYLAKHRGYRSGPVPQSSKSKSNNKDSVKTINEIQKTKSLLGYDIDKNSYQKTIAQYVVQNIHNSIYRNRDGQVVFMAQKEMIEYEAREILRYQSKFYKEIDDKFVDKIIDIINLKAPAIDEKSINEIIGDCAILKDERRAFKNSITATKSMIFQIINNTIQKYQLDPIDNLYIDAMNIIIKKGKLTFENLNSILSSNITTKDKEKLIDNKATNMLKDICKILNIDNYNDMNNKEDELNELIYIFAIYKDFMHCEEKFAQHLAKYSYTDSQKDEILNLCFNKISGTSNLSLKALKGIEPYLIDGYVYTIACDEYIKHLDDKSKIKANSIKSKYLKVLIKKENPRVRKIVNQAIILINTLIKNGAKFDQINIELARDLPLTTKEKKRYSESQKRNEENKKSAKAIVGQNAKNKDILKARLLIEQDYQCPYCNMKLNSSDIADNKVEIDHILPLSLSFDDSYTNKVLTHKECNQLKGQRIPRSGFLDDEWFVSHINSIPQSMSKRKRDNLLITLDEFEKHIENIEKSRALNETRYASRLIKNYIEENLKFEGNCSDISDIKNHNIKRNRVQVRNGSLTHILRNLWHIGDKNIDEQRYIKDRDIHTHHAQDAVIIAFSTQGMVKSICDISKRANNEYRVLPNSGEVIKQSKNSSIIELAQLSKDTNDRINRALHSSMPMVNMNETLNERLKWIIPSKKVDRLHNSRSVHEDTICSIRLKENGNYRRLKDKSEFEYLIKNNVDNLYVIKRVSVKDAISKTVKENKEDKFIFEYLIDKDSRNKELYSMLKNNDEDGLNRYFHGKSLDKAKISILSKYDNRMRYVRGGVANLDRQDRYLIYRKDGIYHVGVVYSGDDIKDDKSAVIDILKKGEKHTDHQKSNNGFEYVMTLYKNDLILYTKGKKEHIRYIDGINISNVDFDVSHPLINDNKNRKIALHVCNSIERLDIDILGNVYRNGKNFTKEAAQIIQNEINNKDK
ncbi:MULTISPECIES: type II CRISPR RNA-guided endonuclease Cas9 [unclassified Campylobacter]|uniref:type II CRISPR RNA-guided endonuclease Cas9 n=1 Tax=unclassified Campylobacter TaxID=2593542 RepID=UPI00301DCFFE|nr:type II CRISPR RNA-guided endonuclease Cas9 [Campylobacter sp. RM9264]MCR8701150.1 type II CRISPR RNA-guided endonuclease Cas9 [Campylobacter sp. RM12176]